MSSIAAMWSPLLFGFALFMNAALLFMVQPMIGRTLLPHLGGNPLAWNACLVFFQATLLAGYVYADLAHRFRGVRWQPWLQFLLIGTATGLCIAGVLGEEPLNDFAARLPTIDTYPIISSLSLLILMIGLPFFALAAVNPLVQRWFAHLDHPKASDPYFLFVASNLGGLTALVLYATLIEPFSPLYAQWLSWKLAVTALGVLLFMVALVTWLSPRNPELEPAPTPTDPNAPVVPKLIGRGPATWQRRLFWLTASALPVGLMMGVTDYLTLDVAPAPILWTLPLALYLLAFSQAFGRFSPLNFGGSTFKIAMHIALGLLFVATITLGSAGLFALVRPGDNAEAGVVMFMTIVFAMMLIVPQSWLGVLQPISVLFVVLLQTSVFPVRGLGPGLAFLHLTCFYLSARLCLGMLANDRPAAAALTTYYNWIGVGGLVGGLFQLLIAPLLFRRDYLEYSLLAALASTLRPAWFTNGLTDWIICWLILPKRDPKETTPSAARRWIGVGFDVAFALFVAVFAAGVFLAFRGDIRQPFNLGGQNWFGRELGSVLRDIPLVVALLFAVILFLRPMRFGFALAAIVCLSFIGAGAGDGDLLITQQRTSFGIMRVADRTQSFRGRQDFGKLVLHDYKERTLLHGITNHGSTIIEPTELHRYPTAYYHELGPAGRVMNRSAWFTRPAQAKEPDWLRHHRDHAPNDARIAASLIGMGAAPLGVATLPAGQLAALWSEPPFAIVGMGTGTLYTYAHPYQWVDAYDLDPAVAALSTGEKPVFHHFKMAQERGVAGGPPIIGDARRNLSRPGRENFYQMIFLDTFNSDAIPIHLLTEEAIVLYFQKLAPGGIICIHTSNRRVELAKVIGEIAQKLKVTAKVANDAIQHDALPIPSHFSSEWVFLTRDAAIMDQWTTRGGVEALNIGVPRPNDPFNGRRVNVVWTDEQASLMPAVRDRQIWPAFIYATLVLILMFAMLLGVIEIATAMVAKSKPTPPSPSSP